MSGRDELTFFDNAEIDTLAALVMDLAAQLHIERQRRMALEEALTRAEMVDQSAIEAMVGDAEFRAKSTRALDTSQARLMRIITERGDRTGPLRDEAPPVEGGT
ncbi:MAG: hypothetical protein AAF414_12875 [Pseudomonadota bacterium]